MKKLAMIAVFGLILFGFSTVVKAEDNKPLPSDTLVSVLAGQCKEVEYTAWSPCDTRFNFNFRTIITPVSGCRPTGIQQAMQLKFCNSDTPGIGM